MVFDVIKHVDRDSSSSFYNSKSTSIRHNNQLHNLNKRKMFLFACIVSVKNSEAQVFQRSLSDSLQIHGDPVPMRNTTVSGQS